MSGFFKKKGKYSNCKKGWRTIGGQRRYFKSAWESNIARYLEFLKQHGEIKKWTYEKDEFWFEGIRRGVCSYRPDFKVTWENGSIEYWEVKGWLDPRSATKLKRMKKYHPSVRIRLIDKDAYKSIEKSVSYLIRGWE